MKSSFLAIMALLGHASAVQLRKESMYDPEFYAGLYTNVLLDVDSYKHRVHHNNVHSKDEYDLDPHTVSAYDDMANNNTWTNKQRQDWFDEAKKHQNQKIYAQVRRSHNKKDSYDGDSNTASTYDEGANINNGNAYGINNSYTDNDKEIGPKEADLRAAIKKGYWWNKELDHEMSRLPGKGQADARNGFAGAIPTDKDGSLNCPGVGATCDVDKVHQDEVKEAKDAKAAEEGDEATKEAKKIVAEEKDKAAKKEKGEGPAEDAPPAEVAGAAPAPETPAAFSQMKHKHSHGHRHQSHHHHH